MTWRDQLNLINAQQQNAGNLTDQMQVFTYLDTQGNAVKTMVETGFTQMEQIIVQLNQFREILQQGMEATQDQIKQETYSELLGGVGPAGNKLGTKVDMLARKAEALENAADKTQLELKGAEDAMKTAHTLMGTLDDKINDTVKGFKSMNDNNNGIIEGRLMVVERSMETLHKMVTSTRNQGGDQGNGGESNRDGMRKGFSILECKSVSDIKKIGNNRGEWKEWIYQTKNILKPILGNTLEWEYWFKVAEENYAKSGELKEIGEDQRDDIDEDDYDKVGEMLKALMVNKLESGTEPAMIMKRYVEGDGLEVYAELVRYYMELTGQGLREIMREVSNPKSASKDEDVMRYVEKWEDDYKQAISWGMTPLVDLHKITILESQPLKS